MRARLDGRRNREIFPILLGRELEDAEARTFAEEKEALYRDLSRGRLLALRGLDRLLERIAARRLPVAVATSAPAANVEHTLGELGLRERFPHVVRSEQVARGKPHPDVFVAAARAISVAPTDCLGFEDAPMGVRAARAAGMACVGVATSFSAAVLRAEGAEAVVADFEEYLAGPGAWLLGGTTVPLSS
jgi:HAD superfamily hydrolase (TIGR01509 family)